MPRRAGSNAPMGLLHSGHVAPLGAYVMYSHLISPAPAPVWLAIAAVPSCRCGRSSRCANVCTSGPMSARRRPDLLHGEQHRGQHQAGAGTARLESGPARTGSLPSCWSPGGTGRPTGSQSVGNGEANAPRVAAVPCCGPWSSHGSAHDAAGAQRTNVADASRLPTHRRPVGASGGPDTRPSRHGPGKRRTTAGAWPTAGRRLPSGWGSPAARVARASKSHLHAPRALIQQRDWAPTPDPIG